MVVKSIDGFASVLAIERDFIWAFFQVVEAVVGTNQVLKVMGVANAMLVPEGGPVMIDIPKHRSNSLAGWCLAARDPADVVAYGQPRRGPSVRQWPTQLLQSLLKQRPDIGHDWPTTGYELCKRRRDHSSFSGSIRSKDDVVPGSHSEHVACCRYVKFRTVNHGECRLLCVPYNCKGHVEYGRLGFWYYRATVLPRT